jgi:CheY-like chemotaxis protein
MHGGTVAVRSAGVDRGSTFEIRLPAVDDATLERQPSRGARPAARRVLVVDDNVDAAQALALVLQLDGHEVRAAFGAAEALGCALESPPDVVLLDIGLPEMDGYAVARELRRKPELAGVRLVALTGYGQPEDRERARDAGFDAHLVKPVDPELLDAALAGEPRGAARHP